MKKKSLDKLGLKVQQDHGKPRGTHILWMRAQSLLTGQFFFWLKSIDTLNL